MNLSLIYYKQTANKNKMRAKVIWQWAALLQTYYFAGRGSRIGLATVPLDRELWCSYRLSVVIIPLSATVWLQFAMQILTTGSKSPNLPFLWGEWSPYLIRCYLGPQECPCHMASHSVQWLQKGARV